MQEFLKGFGILIVYFISCASCALVLKLSIAVPKELFRKILHLILLGSISVFIFGFSTWWISALASLIFAIIVYPILKFAEHFKGYSQLLTERKSGEIKHSLLLVFSMFAVVIAVCWGIFGDKLLALASVLAWGPGDAAAALVGKRFGKHKIKLRNGVMKSWEGSLSMFVMSFLSVLLVLLWRSPMPIYVYITVSVVTALVCTAAELYTLDGNDTVTCPISAMTALLPLLHLFGGL